MVKIEDFFTSDNISEVYEGRIRQKSGRGIDRISVVDFDKRKDEHFDVIRRKCLDLTYRFSPYIQRLILKGANECPRSISIPTVRDKIVLSILNTALQRTFSDSVKRELPNVKVRNLANALVDSGEGFDFHRVDITRCYDNIDHIQLLEKLQKSELDKGLLKLIKMAIKNFTVPVECHRKDRKRYAGEENKGVPQGIPISNMLAEIYLKDIDDCLNEKCFYYDRYVDDIIALTKNDVDFKIFCEEALKSKGLGLNADKSSFCCQDECVSYLGYTFSRENISVSQKTLEKYFRSISRMFVRLKKLIYLDKMRKEKKNDVENIKRAFLEDLNVKIAGAVFQHKRYGWIQYFSEINDKSIPYLIDNFVLGQFKRCSVFSTVPQELKKASRAFYELKYNWRDTKYLYNYELLNVEEKRAWLTDRGFSFGFFTKEKIDRLYNYHVGRFLNFIEKDMGAGYKI